MILQKLYNLRPILSTIVYNFTLLPVHVVNLILIYFFPKKPIPRSVLHVSYMVHVPWYTTRLLRNRGWKADFLAIGDSQHWNLCDYNKKSINPLIEVFQELLLFWKIMARYEVVHFHFMITMTRGGWELSLLKKMGRRVIAHFRGCEVRNSELNMRLHPLINICQQCDYNSSICLDPINHRRRILAERFADETFVTTPDMLDFLPNAIVSSFIIPPNIKPSTTLPWDGTRPLRLVHVTNHPGIEGTELIEKAVHSVRKRGYQIDFTYMRDVSHSEVISAFRNADITIGKMKMGYYANAQIESLACGVPAITWIRPEFMTQALRNSGFIITHIDELEETLVYYLSHPEELNKKREICRSSIMQLHEENSILDKIIKCYNKKN